MLDYTGAIFLIVLTFALPISFSFIRHDRKLLVVFYLVLTVQHLISFFNYFVFTLPGADLDASTFSDNAQSAAIQGITPMISVGTDIYEYILFLFYSLFGINKLVGQSLSILLAAFSCVFILRIARHLDIRKSFWPALILITGFTPSFLLYTSLTFREVYQLLGLAGGVYFSYEAFSKGSIGNLFISSAFFIFMGIFHQVLLALSFTLILISWLYYFLHSGMGIRKIAKHIVISSIMILVAGYIVVLNVPTGNGNDYLRTLVESGSVLNMVDSYRRTIEGVKPRSDYGMKVDTSSFTSAAYGLTLSYGNYLFGPGITAIKKPIDMVAFINSSARVFIFLFILYLLIRKYPFPNGIKYLSFVYFSVSGMWSLGTTNYGQAFRHNSLTDWILAMALIVGIQMVLQRREQGNQEGNTHHP